VVSLGWPTIVSMSPRNNRSQKARSYWGLVNHYYDSSNHIGVLFCRYGSIWPKVLPFCILNLTLSCLLVYLMRYHGITLDISSQTHGVLSVIAAFLSVTKISMSLDRFQQLRAQFSILYREPREFIQHMVVFSKDDSSAKTTTTSNTGTGMGQSSRPKPPPPSDPNSAADWRNEVAYLVVMLIRTVVASVRYDFSKLPAWNIPELLNSDLRKDLCKSLKIIEQSVPSSAIDLVVERDSNFRVPIRIAYLLRKSIYSQHKRLHQPLEYLEESTLFNSLTIFMAAYHEYVNCSCSLSRHPVCVFTGFYSST
jgi:Bestrophin, RFP-TM, chloride channel